MTRGNLLPALPAILEDINGPFNLSGATVVFHFEQVSTDPNRLAFSGPANIISAVAGTVEYPWIAGDTDGLGDYQAKFRATITATGDTIDFPNDSFILFRIVDAVPAIDPTVPAASTPLRAFYEPVRAFLGDFDDTLRRYDDRAIDAVVRSLVQCGQFSGYTVTADFQKVAPAVSDPRLFGLLVYKACETFAAPESQSYSYRTRALSESFGDNKMLIWRLEQLRSELENGENGMCSSWQSFLPWAKSITGINLWAQLSEVNVRAPVATITIGRDGVQVQG